MEINNKFAVWWATLPERNGAANDQCFNALLDVAENCGKNGYNHIRIGYTRTDFARNEIIRAFLANSKRDNDLLVMLDGDHLHPMNIVEQFASNDPAYGVVGALAYRRGEPYDPLWFVRKDGALYAPADFERGPIYQCAIVSTSAIAIRKWVFIELAQRGDVQPYFRYEYPVGGAEPSEDMYFGRVCEQAGIPHYVDTSIVIPHARHGWVDDKVHQDFLAAHPEQVKTAAEVGVINK